MDEAFRDPTRPLDQRVDLLLAQLTVPEKISQLMHDSAEIVRLGIPAYNWWNEACHGVGRNGSATVFPQNIGLGATFDRALVRRVGEAIAVEARAKHAAVVRRTGGATAQYEGLTFWTPNINLYRDPRWGRGQETFGEDPRLTGELAVALVRGLQGDDPDRLSVAACAKHFAVHSGPESQRHGFDARVSARDLRESYLPHFEQVVRAGVEAVMGAYNRVNGEPSCASPTLQRILREEWGFAGHFVSDCGALDDFHRHHGVTADAVASAARALQQGCDLNCGCTYNDLLEAVRQGLVAEADLDRSLRRLLRTRFRLGHFDPPAPASAPSLDAVNSREHRELARSAAVTSMVLLKNDGILPLSPALRSVCVVGPGAASTDVLLGNYFGLNPRLVTVLEGIVGRAPAGLRVQYASGCLPQGDATQFSPAAVYECSCADLTIAVLGTLPVYEGEEGDAFASPAAGDREAVELAASQRAFLDALRATGKPVVLILTGGGAIACPDAHAWCAAILQVWYPGCEGGTAVASVLWGDAEPGGRLPVTVPRATADLPPFDDYAMAGRTYRFAQVPALYPFGYGLGYTRWRLDEMSVAPRGGDFVCRGRVRNDGVRPGRTVVQLYTRPPEGTGAPPLTLIDFFPVDVAAGTSVEFVRPVPPTAWQVVDADGSRRHHPGAWQVVAAFAAPIACAVELDIPAARTVAVSVT